MSDHYCCKRCGLRYDDCTCKPLVDKETPVKFKLTLTEWFPSKVDPVRSGWYLCKTGNQEYMLYYNYTWFWTEDQEEDDVAARFDYWRGVLK